MVCLFKVTLSQKTSLSVKRSKKKANKLITCCPSLNSTPTCTYSRCPCIAVRDIQVLCGKDPDSFTFLPWWTVRLLCRCASAPIKRCLWASCLPSARFIIKVSEREESTVGGKGEQPSRFTNLWRCFHGQRGPLLQFLWNTQLSVCEGSARGLPLLACCPASADSPCATPHTYR